MTSHEPTSNPPTGRGPQVLPQDARPVLPTLDDVGDALGYDDRIAVRDVRNCLVRAIKMNGPGRVAAGLRYLAKRVEGKC